MDLFAGCGGLTSGFVRSGHFTPVLAVESDVQAAATYASNFGDHVDVEDVAIRARGSFPQADVVVGGPPCQGFSLLGRRDPLDPRNGLWRSYVEVVRRVRPAYFVLENVPQFLGSAQFALLRSECRAGGALESFELETHVLRADRHGVAQARRRAFVIGRRLGLRPVGPPEPLPSMTLSAGLSGQVPEAVPLRRLASRTTRFAGADLPGSYSTDELHVLRPVSTLAAARYRAIPPGGARRDLPPELQTPGWRRATSGSGDVMGRLSWDKPSVTIRTEFFRPEKGRFIHPEEHRPITHAEAAMIQGFPRDYRWCGSLASIARQIGNAVPPPLASALALRIAGRIAA